MGLFDGLLKPQVAVQAVDSEWPDEGAPGYYEEAVPTYQMPPTVGVDVPYLPTERRSIPGRGVVDHGVPVDTEGYIVAPATEELIAERERVAREEVHEDAYQVDQPEPVRVAVVELPVPITQQKKFSASQYDLTGTFVVGPPIVRRPMQVVGRRANRTRIMLRVDADSAFFGPDVESLQNGQNGSLILPGDGYVSLYTTEPVWVCAASATPNDVHVVEEFEIDAEITNEHAGW